MSKRFKPMQIQEGFDWCQALTFKVKERDANGNLAQRGQCVAKLVQHSKILDDFYPQMEAESQDLCDIAFQLFDRWGRLKPVHQEHPIKKGNGVWGSELNEADFLTIESIAVDKEYQRRALGTKCFEGIMKKAKKKGSPKFVLAYVACLNSEHCDEELEAMDEDTKRRYFDQDDAKICAFFRSLGFRRIGVTSIFGFAVDLAHPSHALRPEEDFDLPKDRTEEPSAIIRTVEEIMNPSEEIQEAALFEDEDEDDNPTLEQDQDCAWVKAMTTALEAHSAFDQCWYARTAQGNNLLHLASKYLKRKAMRWILENLDLDQLITLNNLGESPSEIFAASLDESRVQRPQQTAILHISDHFKGYSDEDVVLLVTLRKDETKDPAKLARVKYGCTCDLCLDYISPRTKFALICAAHLSSDCIRDEIEGMDFDSVSDRNWLGIYVEDMSPAIKDTVTQSRASLQAFTDILQYIGDCLETSQLPTARNVLSRMGNAGANFDHVHNLLEKGVSVEDGVQYCFDIAMNEARYLGDWSIDLTFKDEIDALPECRNDWELVAARRIYAATQGKPLDEPESVVTRDCSIQ